MRELTTLAARVAEGLLTATGQMAMWLAVGVVIVEVRSRGYGNGTFEVFKA